MILPLATVPRGCCVPVQRPILDNEYLLRIDTARIFPRLPLQSVEEGPGRYLISHETDRYTLLSGPIASHLNIVHD